MKKIKNLLLSFILAALAAFIASPVLYVFFGSVRGGGRGYADFFVWNPVYLHAMCNSLLISVCASLGAVLVSVPAALVYAKAKFKGSRFFFFLYIVIMLMPFQVTMLPHYIVSKTLGVYDTLSALILPGIFSPLPVFLMTQLTRKLPDDVFEAASLETSSLPVLFRYIYMPMIRPGIICSAILVYAEFWNAVSEPMVLLESRTLYPIALLLNAFEALDLISFAAAALFCALPMLLFVLFASEIKDGLGGYQLK